MGNPWHSRSGIIKHRRINSRSILTRSDVAISNSDIYAGSGKINSIYVNAGDMVSAGDGDDVITQAWWNQWSWWGR